MRSIESATVFLGTTLLCLLPADLAVIQSTLLWLPLGEPGTGGRIDSISISPYDFDHLLAHRAPNVSWQAKADNGYDLSQFQIA